jgi:hypothetical protein
MRPEKEKDGHMADYTFKLMGRYLIVKAQGFDEALRKAGIEEGENYEVMEIAHYGDCCRLPGFASVPVRELPPPHPKQNSPEVIRTTRYCTRR